MAIIVAKTREELIQQVKDIGNPVSISIGTSELSPHQFILSEVHENCKVEILKCQTCGEISIGWYES